MSRASKGEYLWPLECTLPWLRLNEDWFTFSSLIFSSLRLTLIFLVFSYRFVFSLSDSGYYLYFLFSSSFIDVIIWLVLFLFMHKLISVCLFFLFSLSFLNIFFFLSSNTRFFFLHSVCKWLLISPFFFLVILWNYIYSFSFIFAVSSSNVRLCIFLKPVIFYLTLSFFLLTRSILVLRRLFFYFCFSFPNTSLSSSFCHSTLNARLWNCSFLFSTHKKIVLSLLSSSTSLGPLLWKRLY